MTSTEPETPEEETPGEFAVSGHAFVSDDNGLYTPISQEGFSFTDNSITVTPEFNFDTGNHENIFMITSEFTGDDMDPEESYDIFFEWVTAQTPDDTWGQFVAYVEIQGTLNGNDETGKFYQVSPYDSTTMNAVMTQDLDGVPTGEIIWGYQILTISPYAETTTFTLPEPTPPFTL